MDRVTCYLGCQYFAMQQSDAVLSDGDDENGASMYNFSAATRKLDNHATDQTRFTKRSKAEWNAPRRS
jgi:hypothetical protein